MRESTMEAMLKTKSMVTESLNGLMVDATRDNGPMANRLEMINNPKIFLCDLKLIVLFVEK